MTNEESTATAKRVAEEIRDRALTGKCLRTPTHDELCHLASTVLRLDAENDQFAAALRTANTQILPVAAKTAADIDAIKLELARLKAPDVVARAEVLAALKLWVAERREADTANRPDENIHKRSLLTSWNQVEAKLDELLAREASR